jgi:hypothetical protein
MSLAGPAATQRRRKLPGRGVSIGVAVAVAAFVAALSLAGAAVAAVPCEYKASPPYGGSYGEFNVPSPPGTHNVYYSYWNTFSTPYYARRREADGTIRYENLRSSGGMWDFANCFNGICTNVERRTQLKNSNGASNWSWEIEAWNTTSLANC